MNGYQFEDKKSLLFELQRENLRYIEEMLKTKQKLKIY